MATLMGAQPLRERATKLNDFNGRKGPFRFTQLWNDIIEHLKDNVEVRKRRQMMKTHENCFTGTEAVDSLIAFLLRVSHILGCDITREKAIKLAQALMESHVFECVTCSHGQTKKTIFEDSNSCLYRFCDDTSRVTPRKESKSPKTRRRRRSSFGLTKHKQAVRAALNGSPDINRVISNPNPFSPYGELFHRILHGSERRTQSSTPCGTPRGSPRVIMKQLAPTDINLIWKEIALERLLHIVDLPFLDHVLQLMLVDTKTTKDDGQNVVISNAFARGDSPFMKRSLVSDSDPWIVAALNCLDQHPESLQIVESLIGDSGSIEKDDIEEVEYIKKCALFKAVSDFYHNRKDPMLPKGFFELYLAMQKLLSDGKCEQALEAVQLHMLLLNSTTRNNLKRLLDFMACASLPGSMVLNKEVENRTLVRRTFTNAILNHPMLTKGQAEQLVIFMMDKHSEVFLLPDGITTDVDHRIQSARNGRDAQITTTYCDKISGEEYEDHKLSVTQNALQELMNLIIDDLKLSLKEKKQKLKQLQKHHPEVYNKHFATML
ncbi:DEP domain-containing protein 7-like [Glandiceps talaboti]